MTEHSPDLLAELAKWDTPTICNALEVTTPQRRGAGFTVEHMQCLYPTQAPIVGYARTATIRAAHPSILDAATLRAKPAVA